MINDKMYIWVANVYEPQISPPQLVQHVCYLPIWFHKLQLGVVSITRMTISTPNDPRTTCMPGHKEGTGQNICTFSELVDGLNNNLLHNKKGEF